jgi:hypothetical protein
MKSREHDPSRDFGNKLSYQGFKHWVERRLAHRRDVNIPALVLQGTRVQSALLSDVSDVGFGLSKVTQLSPDQLVSVATDDGQVLEGRVVWVADGRAGVLLISRN